MRAPDDELEALLVHIKEERGFDFTGYKRASLTRRISRRLSAVGADSFEEYQDHLVMHPEEFTALFNTVLINVTGFFRDPDAWQYLQEHVLAALSAAKPTGPLRAWCAGCASGEEAYTLAMVFAEVLGVEQFCDRVKIYATDLDKEALAAARAAQYAARQVQHLPAQLRSRYFEQHGERFTFAKELRRAVIFGRNDLVRDAPISHVDVLTCRNTLMYFNAETQDKIVQRLHFALNPEGVLLLGKAEMLLSHPGLFRPLEVKRRFFAKVPSGAPERRALLAPDMHPLPKPASSPVEHLSHAAVLSAAPAQILLDVHGTVVLVNAKAAQLFGLSAHDVGSPIQDLEISYRPVELRVPLEQASSARRQVWVRDVSWSRGQDRPLTLDVQFVPLSDSSSGLLGCAVVFHDVTHPRQLQLELEYANRHLETAYAELQSTNEELETTNEELQSTVEELETTNEELQSSNEELETMNEELQSMNDVLHSTNAELHNRQEEVGRVNRFLTAVLHSVSAGIAVVDRDVRVLAWNPQAEQLWGVRAEEAIGQHLFNLDIGLPVDEIRPLLEQELAGSSGEHTGIRLDAVNRRGRPVQVYVTVTRLLDGVDVPTPGAILLMDLIEDPRSMARTSSAERPSTVRPACAESTGRSTSVDEDDTGQRSPM